MPTRTNQLYRNIVARAEDVARTYLGEPLHIQFLCRKCGVTERTLRTAFKSVCGSTPYRLLREGRMREARRALLHAPSGATVTSIATQFGFLELGRFSVEYRSAYGERPSDTLRRSASPEYPGFQDRFDGLRPMPAAAPPSDSSVFA